MSRIVVTPLEPNRFGVEVTEGEVTTSHKVSVPEEFVDDLNLRDVDLGTVVEESFAFLLDREPASAIQGDFPIDQIATRHIDYYDELRTRLNL
ncbi:MAG TPA: hypothetical protein VFH58_05820 [Acidimicrobiales bacterium]|nr:hypothetical protein [Acidimicrobiales bacterium]